MLGQPISRGDINDEVKKYMQLQQEIAPFLEDEASDESKGITRQRKYPLFLKSNAWMTFLVQILLPMLCAFIMAAMTMVCLL